MPRTLLRRRDFQLLAGAVGVSALGDWLALTPLALQLEAMTGSGLAVAALFITVWSPAIVLAGGAGALVDRLETRRLLALVSLVQAAVAVGLAFTDSVAGAVPAAAGLVGLALYRGVSGRLAPADAPAPAVVGAAAEVPAGIEG